MNTAFVKHMARNQEQAKARQPARDYSAWLEVSKDEFDRYVSEYPRPLRKDVTFICEPPLLTYNDFSDGKMWPESIVAKAKLYDGSEYHCGRSPVYFLTSAKALASTEGNDFMTPETPKTDADHELREQAYRRPDAIIAYSANGGAWPGYYIPLVKHIDLERELATAIRERDNALSDWKQADTDSIRAIHERNEARAEVERMDVTGIHSCHDECPRYACTLRRERDALASALREIILADSLNDARVITREVLTKLKP